MSRIKGWKKFREDELSGITWSRIDYPIVYVQMYKSKEIKKGKLSTFWKATGTNIKQRDFKTKEKAFKYAVDYMRKHPFIK